MASTTAVLISVSDDLLPIVLSSRPISWTRKSSRRPTAPGAGDQRPRLVEVAREPDQLLGDVGAIGEQRDLLREAGRIERPRVLAVEQAPHALVEPPGQLVRHGGGEVAIWTRSAVSSSSRAVSSAASASPSAVAHPLELGERRVERRRAPAGSSSLRSSPDDHHAGLREHERELGRGDPEPGRELGEHPVGACRGLGVDRDPGRRALAADVDRDRDRAALDRGPHPRGDRLLERRRERRAAQLEVEEAVVDRADIDGRPQRSPARRPRVRSRSCSSRDVDITAR